MKKIVKDNEYRELLNKISSTFLKAKQKAFKAINQELIISNWETGKHIIEFEQKSKSRIW